MIIRFSRNEVIDAIRNSNYLEKGGIKIEFINCYINDNGNPKIKAEINDDLPHYYNKGTNGDIENASGWDNYRYFKDYGKVKISCTKGNILRVKGLYGADNHNLYNDKYYTYNNVRYKFVSSGVKEVEFLPTLDWIYGYKKDNVEYKTRWDDFLAENSDKISHVDRREETLTLISNSNDTLTIGNSYTVETNVIDVDPGSEPYSCSVTKIHGNKLPQDIEIDGELYMLPVLKPNVDDTNDNRFYITGHAEATDITSLGDGEEIVIITDADIDNIKSESITINSLEGATLDEENNYYTRKIVAPEGIVFTEIIVETYCENKRIDALNVYNTGFVAENETIVSINPITASSNKLLREVTTIVNTESRKIDCILDGEEKDTFYQHIQIPSRGKLLREVKSIVNFEDAELNVLEDGQYSKKQMGHGESTQTRYYRNPYKLNGKLIREVSPYVIIDNPVIDASNIVNGDVLNKIDNTLIDSINLSGLVAPLNITVDDIKDENYEYNYEFIPYPLNIDIVNESCLINSADIKDEPWVKRPNKDNSIFKQVNINAVTSETKIEELEQRDITFVEPRVPTVYYGIYIQLLKKMSEIAPELLKDCDCGCNSINQKLISLWSMFNYACAEYMNDKNSKVAATIIKTIVSQLNLMYNEDEDFLITKYYVGLYKNKTNDRDEFKDVNVYTLIPKEIDVCSINELTYKLYHNKNVHYIMLPPNLSIKKVWYENMGTEIILFDADKNINEYKIRLQKFSNVDNPYTIYWYYNPYPIESVINIELIKK